MVSILDTNIAEITKVDLFDWYYETLGRPIIPLNGKAPVPDRWQTAGDKIDVARQLTARHKGNIGLVCGGGVFILDVDSYEPEGALSWEALREIVDLPETPQGITGRDGLEVVLTYDTSRWAVGTRAPMSDDYPGIDVRGDGGQQVVWPSIHPDTGQMYHWEESSRPGDIPVAEAPDELLELIACAQRLDGNGQSSSGSGYVRGEDWRTSDRVADVDRQAAELLEDLGGHGFYVNGDGTLSGVRPGKSSGSSVTVGYVGPGVAKLFTPNWEVADGVHLEGGAKYDIDQLAYIVEQRRLPRRGIDLGDSMSLPTLPNLPHGHRLWTPDDVPEDVAVPVLGDAAYCGPVEEFLGIVQPGTEAGDAALIATYLVVLGNLIGRGPHVYLDSARHGLNENVILVGDTASARKGSSLGHVERLAKLVDLDWYQHRRTSGLGSGEVVIHLVRDKVMGTDDDGKPVVLDEGVTDKRLLVVAPEYSSILKVGNRESNILSEVSREAWDGRELRNTVKGSSAVATDHHLSVLGHVTPDELRMRLTEIEQANGYANRNLWIYATRARHLPLGGEVDGEKLQAHAQRLIDGACSLRYVHPVTLSEEAKEHWIEVYPALSGASPGLVGLMSARRAPHVCRLAMLYATIDGRTVVSDNDLHAAIAVWDYSEATLQYIFGDALGDPDADAVLEATRGVAPDGISRTELHSVVSGRHATKAARLSRAIDVLERRDLVVTVTEDRHHVTYALARGEIGESGESHGPPAPRQSPQTPQSPPRTEETE